MLWDTIGSWAFIPAPTRLLCNGNATTANSDQVNGQPIELVHEQWYLLLDLILVLEISLLFGFCTGSLRVQTVQEVAPDALIWRRSFDNSLAQQLGKYSIGLVRGMHTLEIFNPQG